MPRARLLTSGSRDGPQSRIRTRPWCLTAPHSEPSRHSPAQAADRAELGRAWIDNGLVFTTRTGRPVEPRNLARSFHRICAGNRLRNIKLHHLRHPTATLLKNLGVPARDAQLIFGHSRLAVTLEIYSHEDKEAHRQALTKIGLALREQRDGER